MSRNAISAHPEHYLFTIFRTPRSPNKFFLPAAWLQNFFGIDSPPPPKQKILDRTLNNVLLYCIWKGFEAIVMFRGYSNSLIFCLDNDTFPFNKSGTSIKEATY